MHSKKYDTYLKAAARGHLTTATKDQPLSEAIELEAKADVLISEFNHEDRKKPKAERDEYTAKTTRSYIETDEAHEAKYEHVSMNDPGLAELPSPTLYATEPDPDEVAAEIIAANGTPQQIAVFDLYLVGLNGVQIASKLNISRPRVSQLIKACQEIIAAKLSSRMPPIEQFIANTPIRDTDKDIANMADAIRTLQQLGRLVTYHGMDKDGDLEYMLDNRYILRADQLQTLVVRRAVRTSRYGLIHISPLLNKKVL